MTSLVHLLAYLGDALPGILGGPGEGQSLGPPEMDWWPEFLVPLGVNTTKDCLLSLHSLVCGLWRLGLGFLLSSTLLLCGHWFGRGFCERSGIYLTTCLNNNHILCLSKAKLNGFKYITTKFYLSSVLGAFRYYQHYKFSIPMGLWYNVWWYVSLDTSVLANYVMDSLILKSWAAMKKYWLKKLIPKLFAVKVGL